MALSIDATAKGASANSYVTLSDADSYMDGRLEVDDWDAAADDTKNRALKMATDRLEQEEYVGAPTDGDDQRLKWPRIGTYDEDGYEYDSDTVPRPIEEATYELALAYVKGAFSTDDSGLEDYRRVRVGPLDVSPNLGRVAGTLPRHVRRLIAHVAIASSGLTTPIDRN